jgi:hypothetical protein
MIVSRVLDSLSIDEDISADLAIQALFPESSLFSNENGFEYLVSRTSFRPREVIQFCNLALEEASLLDITRITSEAVLRAEEIFSTWKLDHIVAENMYIYPGLQEIFEYMRGRTKKITYQALDGLLTDVLLSVDSDENLPEWLRSDVEPQKLMQILYDSEIIGIEKADISNERQRKLESAYDFSFRRPKGKPELSQSFLFHPGLWKSLDLI